MEPVVYVDAENIDDVLHKVYDIISCSLVATSSKCKMLRYVYMCVYVVCVCAGSTFAGYKPSVYPRLQQNWQSHYIVHFHISVDAVTKGTITKMENMATCYLKKWLNLPRSATHAILYYPGVVPTDISRHLLSCISASSDYKLQELGLQLHLGDFYLQTNDADYSILS